MQYFLISRTPFLMSSHMNFIIVAFDYQDYQVVSHLLTAITNSKSGQE